MCTTLGNVTRNTVVMRIGDSSTIVLTGDTIPATGMKNTVVVNSTILLVSLQYARDLKSMISAVSKIIQISRDLSCQKEKRKNFTQKISVSIVKKWDIPCNKPPHLHNYNTEIVFHKMGYLETLDTVTKGYNSLELGMMNFDGLQPSKGDIFPNTRVCIRV